MKEENTKNSLNLQLIASELIDLLKEKDLKIATAESCTGGLISKLITDIPTASQVFECGICSYSDHIKEKVLHVSKRTLERCTAVSREVAMEMAENVRLLSGADVGLSVTGYAGPATRGSGDIVGLVYFGVSLSNLTTYVKAMLNKGNNADREDIREAAAYRAIVMIIELIKTGELR